MWLYSFNFVRAGFSAGGSSGVVARQAHGHSITSLVQSSARPQYYTGLGRALRLCRLSASLQESPHI
jgi:hypothetical protein